MTRTRTNGASPSRKKSKPPTAGQAAERRTAKRARLLVECMLQEMEVGMADPGYRMSEEWERLFGAKQSMVVNLQKLVAALAAIPSFEKPAKEAAKAKVAPITQDEMVLLKAWLEEANTQESGEEG